MQIEEENNKNRCDLRKAYYIFSENSFNRFPTHLGISLGIATIFLDLSLQFGCIKAAVALHLFLLVGIVRSPLSFFDKTPTGRILARFSKDLEVLDNQLKEQINWLLDCFFEVKYSLKPPEVTWMIIGFVSKLTTK